VKNDPISSQKPSTNHYEKAQKLCTIIIEHKEGLRMISVLDMAAGQSLNMIVVPLCCEEPSAVTTAEVPEIVLGT